jgi:two-component system, OmpR family, response regulator
MSILIVDDDPRLRELLRIALERAGHGVMTAGDGQGALAAAARHNPALVVLDVGLPEMDGFEVCRRLRARSEVPVLFLTARDDEVDRIVGLELGADDYVTKPFSPRELVARVAAILRRSTGQRTAAVLRQGGLALHVQARVATVAGAEVALTATEFQILCALMTQPGRILPRVRLVDAIWGTVSPVSDRTLDSHLRNLRAKLAAAGCTDAIETRHGQGILLGPCT